MDRLIEGELKLLAAYDARQATADARTRATATAALALPTLTLSLTKSFADDEGELNTIYLIVIAAAVVALVASLVDWQRRKTVKDTMKTEGAPAKRIEERTSRLRIRISHESAAAQIARKAWRECYDSEKDCCRCNAVKVRRRALRMWRTRAIDSRHIAQVKEKASAIAMLGLVIALMGSAWLVIAADFK